MSDMAGGKPSPSPEYIFRASITLPDGTVLYAKKFGKRAFRIPISPDKEDEKLDS